MEKMTITEALAEIKLIEKKVQKKRETVMGNLVRPEHVPDAFAAEGGSNKVLTSEIQSITDMNLRLERIRAAIARANLDHDITVSERTKSIHEWLTWKRETAEKEGQFLQAIHVKIKSEMDSQAKQPKCYQTPDGKTQLVNFIPNLDYATYLKKHEDQSTLFEQLDGKLSLKNATIVISI